jgi:hypothetical protein
MTLSEEDKKQLHNLIHDAAENKVWYEPRNHISSLQVGMIQQVHEVVSNDLELAIFMSLQTQVVAETVSDIVL